MLRTKPDTGTAHTEGPWRTDPECGNESVLGPDGFMVADCAIFSMRKGAPTAERNQANARLISAAPDLLDACDFALTILEALGNGKGDAANACRAAIAKATGEAK